MDAEEKRFAIIHGPGGIKFAAEIVQACNAYPALLEACKAQQAAIEAILEAWDGYEMLAALDCNFYIDAQNKARAALAQIEGESR